MLKALLKKQLLETMSVIFKKNNNRKNAKKSAKSQTTAAIIAVALALIIFAFLFGVMALALCQPLVSTGLDWLYFALIATVATLLGVFGSIFSTYSALYEAKDNDMLLSMPIPPWAILFSRMISQYILAFVMEVIVMFPAALVYWMVKTPTVTSIIFILLIILILPLLALSVNCILGWLIALVAPKIKHKNIITVIFSLAFFVGYYYFYSQAERYMNLLVENSASLSIFFKTGLYPFYLLGLAATGKPLSFLLFLLMVGALFSLIYIILSVSFLKISTVSHTARNKDYSGKSLGVSSAGSALLKKEIRRLTTSSTYLLNACIGVLIMIFAAVFAIIKKDMILGMLGEFAGISSSFIPAALCAIVCFLSTMTCITAPSISIEGNSLWILKSMPVTTQKIFNAKILLHLIFGAIPAFLCMLTLNIVFSANPITFILSLAVVVLFNLFSALFGLMMNLKFPNLEWTSEAVAVKQGTGIILSTLVNLGVCLYLIGICAVLSIFLNTAIGFSACIISLLIADLLVFMWLKNVGARVFQNL